ncbi:MAG: thioredoxin family protein [Sulfurimonas sp.]|uniref:thioredoxin family protein n=1 Tax=Sulfurimonas sp. TaxID=2022749 RepID=UPI0026198AF8|nr:thioredoxin family protein [Sulfurimonas sp.]MDD5401619.1 thioredoxin family protein [Sulfurimonas sp.]
MQRVEEIRKNIEENRAVMLYFSAPSCNVCHALKPKLVDALHSNFREMKIISIDVSVEQELAASFSVFAIPTVLIFLDSREFLRKSRHMSVDEVVKEIKRPYDIMCS